MKYENMSLKYILESKLFDNNFFINIILIILILIKIIIIIKYYSLNPIFHFKN